MRARQLPAAVSGLEEEVAIDPGRACSALGVLGAVALMVLAPVLVALGPVSWDLGAVATAVAVGWAAVMGVGKLAAVVVGAARFLASSRLRATAASID